MITRNKKSGFTLFELLIVIAVVGLIMGLVVSRVDQATDGEMKRTSNKLASTIRYIYNKSAMEGLYIRLMIDLEERSYWVEATSDPMVIAREDVKQADTKKGKKPAGKDKDKEKTEEKEGEGKTAAEGEEGGEEPIKIPEPVFSQVDSFLLKPTKLSEDIFIKDVQVEHAAMPITNGKAAIHFFPNGYVEKAVINLKNEADDVNFSLMTSPISGRVSIEAEYRKIGDE